MNVDQPSPSREADRNLSPFVRWVLLTPENDLRKRIVPKSFIGFVLAVDQVITGSLERCPKVPVPLLIAVAVMPRERTIVSVRGGQMDSDQEAAIVELIRGIRALDVPKVGYAPVAFMREASRDKSELPMSQYVAFDDFQSGYNPASLDEVLMEAVESEVGASPLLRETLGPLGSAFSVILPRTTICSQLRLNGLSVLAHRSGIRFRGVHSKWIFELESAGPDEFTNIALPGGGAQLVDEEMLKYLQSEAPQPTQVSLDLILGKVRRIRVFEDGIRADQLIGEKVLLDVSDEESIDEFCRLMEIFDGPAGHCMCAGDPALELLDAQGARVGLIGVHHGRTIRSTKWKSDAMLIDGVRLLDWLAVRGVTAPLDQRGSEAQIEADQRAEFETWKAAMPECLSSLPDEVWRDASVMQELSALHESLASSYPSRSAHIIRLLEWLGEGSGKWTTIPIYELLPEQLLVRFSASEIIEALESSPPTESHLEGAAKVFASVAFQKHLPDQEANLGAVLSQLDLIVCPPHPEPAEIPSAWRDRLLDHCLRSRDPEKRRRAIQAFDVR